MMEVKVNCTHCSKPILARFKFCSECGQANENHDAAAATVMNQGRKRAAKRVRPTNFDVEQLARCHFEGFRAVTDAGQEALLGTGNSDSSSDSRSEQGDADELALAASALATSALAGAKVRPSHCRASTASH